MTTALKRTNVFTENAKNFMKRQKAFSEDFDANVINLMALVLNAKTKHGMNSLQGLVGSIDGITQENALKLDDRTLEVNIYGTGSPTKTPPVEGRTTLKTMETIPFSTIACVNLCQFGDLVRLKNFRRKKPELSEEAKEKGIKAKEEPFYNMREVQSFLKCTIYQLPHIEDFCKQIPIRWVEDPTKTTIYGHFHLPILSQDKVDKERESGFVVTVKNIRDDPKYWIYKPKTGTEVYPIVKLQQSCIQWKGGLPTEENSVGFVISYALYYEKIEMLCIRDPETWHKLMRWYWQYLDYTLVAYHRAKDTTKLAINDPLTKEDNEFGISLGPLGVLFNPKKFYASVGIPVTKEWVMKHYEDDPFESTLHTKNYHSTERNNGQVYFLDEYSGAFDYDNFDFVVLYDANIQESMMNLIRKLSPEEGTLLVESIAAKKIDPSLTNEQLYPGIDKENALYKIYLSVNNHKPFVFALSNKEMSRTNQRLMDLFWKKDFERDVCPVPEIDHE